jgi:dTMP kinase
VTGRFIVFEGGEGTGKSTQAARLAQRLGAVLTREPGGTPLGRLLRAALLDPTTGAIDPRAEALLMAADRAQHVAEVIAPALASGRHVVSDRYLGSSVAYQGGGRGLDVDEVARLSSWATGGLLPDLVLLLEVPNEVAQARLGANRDRFESESAEFHLRVAESFRRQASADPLRWIIIDGTGSPEVVATRVEAVVREHLGLES